MPDFIQYKCTKCDIIFDEYDAASVDVSEDCDEVCIACPKCYSNNLDDYNSLILIYENET